MVIVHSKRNPLISASATLTVSLLQAVLLSFTLLMTHSLTLPSANASTCQPVLDQQTQLQIQRHSVDPAQVVRQATNVLHHQFKPTQGHSSNTIYVDSEKLKEQMSAMFNYFSISTWIDRLDLIKKMNHQTPLNKSEVHFLFTHWIRVKYMTAIYRLIRKRELEEVYRIQGRFPANVVEKTVNNPANIMVTGYSSYSCQKSIDNVVYDCSKKMLWVHTHQSPDVLCSISKYSRDARFKYLVQLEDDKFKIVDVEYEGRRIYRDSYRELELLLDRKNWSEVEKDLKLWTFLESSQPASDAVKHFTQSIPRSNSNRSPASK